MIVGYTIGYIRLYYPHHILHMVGVVQNYGWSNQNGSRWIFLAAKMRPYPLIMWPIRQCHL